MSVRIEPNAEPIPGYRLVERLGGGGFGEVWRALAPGGLHKAIKFVFGDLSAAGDNGQRAEQELKALKRVQSVRHPYILNIERYDITDGQLMIVMELADRNLWDRYKECRAQGLPGIPRDELLGYLEETAEALDLMNREFQLQHLDIKPQNLFLVHNHIKVADFGLVKDLEGSHASITGGITPVYAAPETFEGRVSRTSDQYSLAIVYQELLTGQRPFTGSNVRQLILQHLQGVPNVAPLPSGEQAPISRALSKTPSERFPSCGELVQALRAAPSGPIQGSSEQGLPLSSLLRASRRSPTTDRPGVPLSSIPGSWQGTPTPPGSDPPTANIRGALADTPTAQGVTENIRVLDPAILHEPEPASIPQAPAEITGSGTLFPALIIGIGQVGLTILHKLRETLDVHAAPLCLFTNLRFLLMDTDPEVVRTATRGLR
jgi:serine/threonine protein kinase